MTVLTYVAEEPGKLQFFARQQIYRYFIWENHMKITHLAFN